MKTNKILKLIPQIVVLFVAAFLIFGLSYLIFAAAFKSNFYFDMGEKGAQIGDSMGVLNSFFSVLAFLGVALSLYYQRNAMAKQEEELQLSRNMYIKSGFETTLNGLLESMQQNINDTRGKFIDELGNIEEKAGVEYYTTIYDEARVIFRALRLKSFGNSIYTKRVLNRYNVNPASPNNLADRIVKETVNDFCRGITFAIDSIHRKEYFNAWQTYLIILDTLNQEYELWIQAKLWNPKEIERIFSGYVNLVKSRIPFGAQFYFLYLQKLDTTKPCNDFIHQLFYKETATENFLESGHYVILFGEKKKTVPIG